MNRFLKRTISILLCISAIITGSAQVGDIPRSTPEAEGIPSKAIYTLFDSLTSLPKTDIHSVMIARHGKVVAEIYPSPIKAEYSHTMYSCSKTFVGVAVGLAIDDNKLRLDDRVALFFPEYIPDTVSSQLASMTVRNLLTMTSGIDPDWNMRNITSEWISTYLSKPVEQPGISFKYDSMCTYLLSAIVQKAVGMKLLDYLKLKIFNAMNITDVEWEISLEGFNTGGWGLYIQPESLMKFGLMLINDGKYNGQQLVPSNWVKEMTTSKIKTYACDYCFQTWRSEYPGSYRADGALGQYILMVPQKDIVVVITECTLIDGIKQRQLVWDILMPSLCDSPLPESKDLNTLRKKESAYTLPFPKGKKDSKIFSSYDGKTIILESNRLNWKSITFRKDNKNLIANITVDNNQSFDLCCGHKKWVTTSTNVFPPYSIQPIGKFTGITPNFQIAGSYAWQSNSTLMVRIQYANWVSAVDAVFDFSGENVTITAKENFSNEPFIINGSISQ